MAKADTTAAAQPAPETTAALAQPAETTAAPQTPTAQPATPPAKPVTTTTSGDPVEISFQTGLPKQPATPAATGDQPADPAAKTFTQEQIDAIIAARLADERKKFADYDELKQKAQALEDAQKTEAQKAADRLKELEATNQRLASERQELATRTAIIAAASGIGLDADAAVKLVDAKALQFDDNGNATNAADLVKAVAERYPGLVRKGAPNVPVVNPSGQQQPVGRTDADRRREYFGGGASAFWQGGGVRLPETEQ